MRSQYIDQPGADAVLSMLNCRYIGAIMARKPNKEVTSKKPASAAAKTLRNPKASKAAKSAASALTQRPDKRKK